MHVILVRVAADCRYYVERPIAQRPFNFEANLKKMSVKRTHKIFPYQK